MAKRNKLEKFNDILNFANVYECSVNGYESGEVHNGVEDIKIKGKWNAKHFKNENPVVLELACGRGEYTVQMAELYPDKNFIGVDVKGARIWKGAKKALDQLPNAAFLRIRIEYLAYYFGANEVDEIWITFPDPFLKEKKSNRRLTSPYFINIYRQVLKSNGHINLKTDDDTLYEFTKEVIKEHDHLHLEYDCDDIYAKPLFMPELEFKTYYEDLHLKAEKKIKYIRFKYQ